MISKNTGNNHEVNKDGNFELNWMNFFRKQSKVQKFIIDQHINVFVFSHKL
jgi:hypothetical protein